MAGADVWQNGKFKEYVHATTYNSTLGYPVTEGQTTADEPQERLRTETVFHGVENSLEHENIKDLDDEDASSAYLCMAGIGST